MNTKETALRDYFDRFGESLVVNMMQEADRKDIEGVVKRCMESGKPYDDYIDKDFPPDGMID